jgi:hypothetical protein
MLRVEKKSSCLKGQFDEIFLNTVFLNQTTSPNSFRHAEKNFDFLNIREVFRILKRLLGVFTTAESRLPGDEYTEEST